MWNPALFLITVVVIVPIGLAALGAEGETPNRFGRLSKTALLRYGEEGAKNAESVPYHL